MVDSPMRVRNRIRWHAELGASGFETLPPEDAAEHAQWRLEAIVRYLDRLDDADRSARIFRIAGIEVGEDGEPIIHDHDI